MLKLLLLNYSGRCVASSCAFCKDFSPVLCVLSFGWLDLSEIEDKPFTVQGSDSSAKGRPGGKIGTQTWQQIVKKPKLNIRNTNIWKKTHTFDWWLARRSTLPSRGSGVERSSAHSPRWDNGNLHLVNLERKKIKTWKIMSTSMIVGERAGLSNMNLSFSFMTFHWKKPGWKRIKQIMFALNA